MKAKDKIKSKILYCLFGMLLIGALAWLYISNDKVKWYLWPKQGMGLCMWKGAKLNQYESFKIEWSHGQTWNEKGESYTLWKKPTIHHTKVDFDDLKVFGKGQPN